QDVPQSIAIHFDFHNNPDSYMDKNIVLFLFPIGLALMQIVCCIVSDLSKKNKHYKPKIEYVSKGIVPIISLSMYTITLMIALGNQLDVRLYVCFIISIIFIVVGNYIPKTTTYYLKSYFMIMDEKKQRQLTRWIGYSFVIFGILLLVSLFMTAIYSVIVVVMIVIVLLTECGYFFMLSHKERI
ncbi:MAG: DUF1648 domain-containing protein, partial [Coprobacillus sp.]